MDILESLGEHLRELRLKKGITIEELASEAGFHHVYIGNIERGLENPTVEALAQLADVLDISLKTMFDFEAMESVDEVTE